jgi:cell division protein FtsZ
VNRRGPTTLGGADSTARQLDSQLDPQTDYLDVPAFLRKQAD